MQHCTYCHRHAVYYFYKRLNETLHLRTVLAPRIPVTVYCPAEIEDCPMGLNIKKNEKAKQTDLGFLSQESSALAIDSLIIAALEENAAITFAKTRLGDLSVTIVKDKDTLAKAYIKTETDLFDLVTELVN